MTTPLQPADALQIVIDLARENILPDSEVQQDPEVLEPIVERQKEALAMVEALAPHLGTPEIGAEP